MKKLLIISLLSFSYAGFGLDLHPVETDSKMNIKITIYDAAVLDAQAKLEGWRDLMLPPIPYEKWLKIIKEDLNLLISSGPDSKDEMRGPLSLMAKSKNEIEFGDARDGLLSQTAETCYYFGGESDCYGSGSNEDGLPVLYLQPGLSANRATIQVSYGGEDDYVFPACELIVKSDGAKAKKCEVNRKVVSAIKLVGKVGNIAEKNIESKSNVIYLRVGEPKIFTIIDQDVDGSIVGAAVTKAPILRYGNHRAEFGRRQFSLEYGEGNEISNYNLHRGVIIAWMGRIVVDENNIDINQLGSAEADADSFLKIWKLDQGADHINPPPGTMSLTIPRSTAKDFVGGIFEGVLPFEIKFL